MCGGGSVCGQVGQQIQVNDILLVLEAMKNGNSDHGPDRRQGRENQRQRWRFRAG
jgi:hypothetical protein